MNLKITNNDYFLPIIEAQVASKTFVTGRNKPLLFRGLCQTTFQKDDYVVKFRNSQEMSIEASCRELLASFIALELDLLVPQPVLVNISYDFAQTLRGSDSYVNANNSLGLNFGCRYMEGYFEMVRNQVLSNSQKLQISQIFPYDIFINNSDRRIDKPNCLTDGNNILLFDHELAFGFVFDIFKNTTPWDLRPQDIDWVRNHFFFPYLKNQFIDFSLLINKLTCLDDSFWSKAFELFPDGWKTEQLDEIKGYLQTLIFHKDLFLQSLQNVLVK